MKKNIFLIILIANIIAGCEVEHNYPKSIEEEKLERTGSLFDINNKIFDKKENDKKSEKSKNLGKQNFWQACLNVVSDKKIHFTDFAGGVIVTDWYQENLADNRRYKLVIMVDEESRNFEPILKVIAHEQEKTMTGWADKLNNKEVAEKVRKEIFKLANEQRN